MTIDLNGFYDLHIHSGPDITERKFDDFELARVAATAGLFGIMLKSHVTLTADRAAVAEKHAGTHLRVWGGLALNFAVGGLNPAAVEAAVQMGAKQIWMPTRDAANEIHKLNKGKRGISLLNDGGKLRHELYPILDIVAKANIILGTGHISAEETVSLIRAAHRRGIERILVTHPEATYIRIPIQQQRELARMGCLFERCWLTSTEPFRGTPKYVDPDEIMHVIREVGPSSTVLSSDLGQVDTLSPVDGLRQFVSACMDAGFTWTEVRRMGCQNPAQLVI